MTVAHIAAHGGPVVRGRIRVEPGDFEVDEQLGFAPDDHGTHVLLHVEKCGANTAWVASQLARRSGVPMNNVGFSGLKDRRALTRQWFSVPETRTVAIDAWRSHEGESYRVLEARLHTRKLRRGSHRSNRFRVRLRDLSGRLDALTTRLDAMQRLGVPNYFGGQRFGREGGNLERARDWASSGRAPADRQQRGFALSAARSDLFNQVLAERVSFHNWNMLLPGEAIMLDGRKSFFAAAAIDPALETRCASLDLHPSAPLHGKGESPARGAALETEARVLAREPELTALLEQQGLETERRATRLVVRDLAWQLDGDILDLRFELGRGSFATTVLAELVADLGDEPPAIE